MAQTAQVAKTETFSFTGKDRRGNATKGEIQSESVALANRCKQVIEADGAMYHVAKQIIIASLHGHPQPLVIEAARSSLGHANQPTFADVFDGMRGR